MVLVRSLVERKSLIQQLLEITFQTGKATRPKEVENDASARPLTSASCDLDRGSPDLRSWSFHTFARNCPVDRLCQFASKSVYSFSEYPVQVQ